MKIEPPPLLPLLKQSFGYTTFRPLPARDHPAIRWRQGRFALLPTGGGSRFVFNCPRSPRRLTVVVSPLIALMKDQVDALQASGVAATFLNSSLAADESPGRLRGLHKGEFRLLYVAPERLMLDGFGSDLNAGT